MYEENEKEQQKDEGWRKPKGKSNKPEKKRGEGEKIKRTKFFYFILFFYFQLQSTYLQYLLTYKQYMVLTLVTKLYSTYKTILIYNVRYLRY